MPDVILPVLDEAAAIPAVIEAMPASYTPIVVDNGSRDGSSAVAAALGVRVVAEPARGFGAACHAGLLAATSEIVCFMDCDGSLDARELPSVVEPVARGDADLVLGRRRPQRGSWPAHARAANVLLAALLRARTGVPLHDLGPMRAARREPLLELALYDRAFGYPLEMVVRAQRGGWSIAEVPVSYLPRTGSSKVTGTVRGTARAVRDMTRVLVTARGSPR
jgi:glycosyltransferase involved in cell wall biosynthesis